MEAFFSLLIVSMEYVFKAHPNGIPNLPFLLPDSSTIMHDESIRSTSTFLIYLRNKLNKILADKTNQDIKKIEKDTERDHYLTAKEALEYGLVDKIL